MIIFRYFAREILGTLSAVTLVLLLVALSFRFVKYLAQAASGALEPGALFLIMGWRIPEFLELIVPLGLFLGVLLTFGRMYLDSEMTVLRACGMRTPTLVGMVMSIAGAVAVVLAVLSLWMTPYGFRQVEKIFNEQDRLNVFDILQSGRFQSFGDNNRVTFTDDINKDRTRMRGVFIAERSPKTGTTITIARSGIQEIRDNSGSQYVILQNGYRFEGWPGALEQRVTAFETHGFKLMHPEISDAVTDVEAMPTSQLVGRSDGESASALQWRISTPISALVMALIAIPMSQVNPRQGRFFKMAPAILLYLAYIGGLIATSSMVAAGKMNPIVGVWPVHVIFLAIGVGLVTWEPIQRGFRKRRLERMGLPEAISKDGGNEDS